MIESETEGRSVNSYKFEASLIAFQPRQVSLLMGASKKVNLSAESRPIQLSIASYLKENGFEKTLSVFQKEAKVTELDLSLGNAVSLEMCYKHFESSKPEEKLNLNKSNEQESLKDDSNKTDEKLKKEENPESLKTTKEKKKKLAEGSISVGTQETLGTYSTENAYCHLQLDESVKKPKEKKKKKSKSTPEENVKVSDVEDLAEAVEVKAPEKPKDKKNKKNKLVSEENGQKNDVEALTEAVEGKAPEIPKDKKKKKHKSVCVENLGETVSLKVHALIVEEPVVTDNKKSKKRKRSASEETEEADQSKTEMSDMDSKANGKANIKEEVENREINHDHTGNPQKRAKKQPNGSAEPKTVNAFQRIKIDEVKFADERLQDNSYWAKSGADSGYGAKAQEVLGQVRGKGFRHEKTKKKRGSYRGGQIDNETHSIKFNYSDDE